MVRLLEAIVLHIDLDKYEIDFNGLDALRAKVRTYKYKTMIIVHII